MEQIAEDVFLLRGFPRYMVNVYVVGTVLVDAGIRSDYRRIARQTAGRTIDTHLLTHVHPDHQGASHRLCSERGLPLWCSVGDTPAAESGNMRGQFPAPDHWLLRLQMRFWAGPGHPVARQLSAGDTVGEFEVLDVPGHTAGHIALWRARDKVLIVGDVVRNIDYVTLRPGLAEPPALFTCDPARNRDSARMVAALRPEVVCFGHGPPLRDPARLEAFVAGLA